MSVRKIIALAATAVAVGGAALGATTANAAAGAAVSCSFTGTTTSLTPIPNGAAFAPSNPNPTAAPGQADYTTADQGGFTFGGNTIACTGVDSDGKSFSASAIASSGTYNNVVCGTGNAEGTANIGNIATVAYTIDFANGEGTLRAAVTLSDGVTATAAGTVSIVPNVGGCVTGPATSFTVLGSASGAGA